MTPEQRYQHDLDSGLIFADAAQQQAIMRLQYLYEELVDDSNIPSRQSGHWVRKLLGARVDAKTIKGIYFWGGVGRGKTYLMDIFYESLPFREKYRTHFHRFMQRVHADLTAFSGEKNPLDQVARRIAGQARIICFDEFYVSDIGDAMILANLLEALVARGVVFVMTSNIHPDLLYENGLQRARFVPAIKLIQQVSKVVELDGGTDYRLRSLTQATLFHWPAGPEADRRLAAGFKQLAPDFSEAVTGGDVDILGRNIVTRCVADDVVWFDFAELCGGPRSAFDYVEIAKIYHAVLLSGVPCLDDSMDDQARRFINLVDELYDRRVKLIISAATPMDKIYAGVALAAVFQRTRSRLQEMQSHDYLSSAHRPA